MQSLQIIILIFLLEPSHGNIQVVESNLRTALFALQKQEMALNTSFFKLNVLVPFSYKNLKAINIAQSLQVALEDIEVTVSGFETIDNYQPFSVLITPTPCERASYYSALISYDVYKYSRAVSSIFKNTSKLYEHSNAIYFNVSSNFKDLELNLTRRLLVFMVLNNLKKSFMEAWNYINVANWFIKYAKDAVPYMEGLITSGTITCPKTISYFKANGTKIDDELRNYEKELLALEAIALDKINTALKTVTSDGAVEKSSTRVNLEELKVILEATITASDPSLKWPHIPNFDAGDNGFNTKWIACESKKFEYSCIKEDAQFNRSEITKKYFDLDKSVQSIKKRKVGASPEVAGVLNATWAVIDKFKWFEGKVDDAIEKVKQLMAPNKAICSMTKDIFDVNGKILKTACLVTQLKGFNEAQAFCQANNMPSLYAVTNNEEKVGILAFATSVFAKFTAQKFLSINGVQGVNTNQWFNRNPLLSPLYASIVPNMCASLVGQGTTFVLKAVSCNRKKEAICEFDWGNPNLNLAGTPCSYRNNITDGSGNYVKTICYLNSLKDAESHFNFCKSRNFLGLFSSSNANELSFLINFAEICANNFGVAPSTMVIHVDGYEVPNRKWYKFDLDLLPFSATPLIYEVNFMKVEDTPSGPDFTNYPENPPLWFVCEYKLL